MKSMNALEFLFFFSLLIGGSWSWWEEGHMLVADIAQAYLEQTNSKAIPNLAAAFSYWQADVCSKLFFWHFILQIN